MHDRNSTQPPTSPHPPPSPTDWSGVRRILAVRLDNVGDVVMLSPALRALRDASPSAEITLLTSPAGAQVAPMLPWIDRTWVRSAPWQDASQSFEFDPVSERALVEELAARVFDAAFIFTSFSQSPFPPAYACYLAGIGIRVGESKEFGGSVLSAPASSLPDAAHQVTRNLHLLEAVGILPHRDDLELAISSATQQESRDLLSLAGIDPGIEFVAVAPGASAAARRYHAGRFAAAISAVWRESGLPVVLLGSGRERALCDGIAEAASGEVVSLAGQTSLPVLASVISSARLLLANDSGPMYIADAVNTPMVITFSGTEYESQWEPRVAPHILLRRATDCSPCYAFTCPYHMECLDLPADDVARSALMMLQGQAAISQWSGSSVRRRERTEATR